MKPLNARKTERVKKMPWKVLGAFLFLSPSFFASNLLFAGTVIVTDEVSVAVDKIKGALVQLP